MRVARLALTVTAVAALGVFLLVLFHGGTGE